MQHRQCMQRHRSTQSRLPSMATVMLPHGTTRPAAVNGSLKRVGSRQRTRLFQRPFLLNVHVVARVYPAGTGIISVTDCSNLLPDRVRYSTHNSAELAYPPTGTIGDGYPVDRCDAYRHFAAQCVDVARNMDSPRDRSIMLEMALVWRRLAEYAANTAARKECTEFISPGLS